MKTIAYSILAVTILLVSCGDSSESEGNLERSEKYEEIVDAPLPDPQIQQGLDKNIPKPVTNSEADPMPKEVPTYPVTSLEFDSESHDFGTVNEGDIVSYTFTVVNTGEEPLIISNCKGSCGCTVPACPQEPILPGETGKIPVEYNSKGKSGEDVKTVTVTANTQPANSILTISVNTIPEGEG